MSTLMDEFGRDEDPDDSGRQVGTKPRRSAGGPPPRKRKRGMSPFTAIGLLLLIVGLASLGWVGYQYFGTNAAAEQAFKDEKGQLREEWDKKPADTKGDKEKAKGSVIPGKAIALLRVPAFGKDFEVPILSGIDDGTLSRGIGHFEQTAMPGEVGNFSIAGHRITHGQPFSKLLELKSGDQIVVETREAVFTYSIDTPPKDLTVKANETWVTDPVPGSKGEKPTKAGITLVTCEDLFHSPDRSVGFGHLINTERKADPSS